MYHFSTVFSKHAMSSSDAQGNEGIQESQLFERPDQPVPLHKPAL
jgi:hypothetical protein